MSTLERIAEELKALPEEYRAEILDFVQFMKKKKAFAEEKELKDFSLATAMKGMEDEPDLYTADDVKPLPE